jgi:hypothetical protein
MSTCVLHIGQHKTGTTSIQSTLFWGLRDRRFRLLSLDSFFGNRLLLTATGCLGQGIAEWAIVPPFHNRSVPGQARFREAAAHC